MKFPTLLTKALCANALAAPAMITRSLNIIAGFYHPNEVSREIDHYGCGHWCFLDEMRNLFGRHWNLGASNVSTFRSAADGRSCHSEYVRLDAIDRSVGELS